jgi:hypothetical protein
MRILLSLDLSTTASGWAKYDLDTKKLLSYGVITPNLKNPTKKGIPTYAYPVAQVLKMRKLCAQILDLIDHQVESIVIEEINGSKNRLGQKVLDGFHFVLLDKMGPLDTLGRVFYVDSDGKEGWRSKFGLGLQLSETDKMLNKERKKYNKKLGKGTKKQPLITQKNLACNFVNKEYGLNLNSDVNSTDGDVADAIGLGHFVVTKVLI